MREHIYGWYPSIKNVYKDRIGIPSEQHVNSLYNFKGTMYHTKPVIQGPDNLVILGHGQGAVRQRPLSAAKLPSNPRILIPQRPKTAPLPVYKPIPQLQVPTPQECWSKKYDDCDYVIDNNDYHDNVYEAPSTASTQIHLSPSKEHEPTLSYRRDRIQSATIHRHRKSLKRPTKSAGPVRPMMTPAATPIHIPTSGNSMTPVSPPMGHRMPTPPTNMFQQTTPSRQSYPVKQFTSERMPSFDVSNQTTASRTPSRVKQMLSGPEETEVFVRDEEGDIVPDYDAEKERIGWGVEVPGNPFNLKKIPRRLPYTVKLQIPEVAPEPPKIHMETNETFFQNTIPRRPMAFSIHKDWVSEILHTKRMELQKREGINYRYKNFAFVY